MILGKRALVTVAIAVVVATGLLLYQLWVEHRTVARIPYSEFVELLAQDGVNELVASSDRIRGALAEPRDGKRLFETTRVEPALVAQLQRHQLRFAGETGGRFFTNALSWLLPMLLFLGLWMFLMRRVSRPSDGFLAVGQSRAKVYVESDTHVTFADVAGVSEAKAELQEIVAFLKDPQGYGRLGARMPKGVLLVGPPGTGKTLLARAVAGEAHVSFFSISGSEFVEMFVGVGAARVRDLFEQARGRAPCIIFIDELDAVGKARSAQPGFGGHDEKEQTLNQLLVELDGFDPSSGIVLVGATNRPEILDPALLRAGRFDRQVLVDRPDRRGRAEILEVHLLRIRRAIDVDAERIASLTPGFTGADLANLVNEAALGATRRGADGVAFGDFTLAIERIVAGLEKKNRILNPREREMVAYHEMGHAIVGAALLGAVSIHKVSIIPRGIGALGYTLHLATEDRFLMTRRELEDKLAVLLGGRAAEHVVFGELSTGASDDLVRATEIARSMVTRYAMVPELGHATYERESGSLLGQSLVPPERAYSEQTAREIDCATRQFVDGAFARAGRIVEWNVALVKQSAQLLLERETLEQAELAGLLEKVEAAEVEVPVARFVRPAVRGIRTRGHAPGATFES